MNEIKTAFESHELRWYVNGESLYDRTFALERLLANMTEWAQTGRVIAFGPIVSRQENGRSWWAAEVSVS